MACLRWWRIGWTLTMTRRSDGYLQPAIPGIDRRLPILREHLTLEIARHGMRVAWFNGKSIVHGRVEARYVQCGKNRCQKCPHGPYYYLRYSVGSGKERAEYLGRPQGHDTSQFVRKPKTKKGKQKRNKTKTAKNQRVTEPLLYIVENDGAK